MPDPKQTEFTSRPVAVVDDDPEIRELLKGYLERQSFDVTAYSNGDAFLADPDRDRFALVLLDVMMPGRDGIEVCREIRRASWQPIIMLTAMSSDIDRILGIEVGSDDYLTKPFNPRELLARMKAVLRRTALAAPQASASAAADQGQALHFGQFRLNTDRCQLTGADGAVVDLTAAEFDLLHALALSSGRAVTRGQLLQKTHGVLADADERSVDVLISRLRQKLENNPRAPEIIKTVRQVGYLFDLAVQKVGYDG